MALNHIHCVLSFPVFFSFSTHDLLILRGTADLLFGRQMELIHLNNTFTWLPLALTSDPSNPPPTSGKNTIPSFRTKLSDRNQAVVSVVRSNIQSKY